MASGVLVEIAAIGNQNAYLTLVPELTFFRQLYRRHTNFGKVEYDVPFSTGVSGWNQKQTAVYPKNGDMFGETYAYFRVSALGIVANPTAVNTADNSITPSAENTIVHWVHALGHAMLKEVSFEAGGQCIDSFHGEYMQARERLCGKAGKYLKEMIGGYETVNELRNFSARERELYVHLPFYYSRIGGHGSKYPLIATQYHSSQVTLVTRKREELIVAYEPKGKADGTDYGYTEAEILANISGGAILEMALTTNYVYLDTMERRVMAQQPHEYLIEQVSFQAAYPVSTGATVLTANIYYNHPHKEFIFFMRENRMIEAPRRRYFQFGIQDPLAHNAANGQTYPWSAPLSPIQYVDPIRTVRLQLNGHDRIVERRAMYFRTVVPYEHHSSIPTRFVYNYCFALHPENEAPSGSINLSRIDNVQFLFSFPVDANGASAIVTPCSLYIYGVVQNVLKFAGGMVALRYSN